MSAPIQRSHGAFLLGRVGISDRAIAEKVPCQRVTVTLYRLGDRRPCDARRERFLALFSIPTSSWDRPAEIAPPSTIEQLSRLRRAVTELASQVGEFERVEQERPELLSRRGGT